MILNNQASEGLLSVFLQRKRIKAARPHLSGKVLDVGCGNGALAAFLNPDDYYGFDLNAATVALASRLHPAHTFSDSLPVGVKFDTVTALAVIEHVSNPPAFLSNLIVRLRPNGRIVLTTPHKSLRHIHELGARIGLFSHEAAAEHEVMFDKSALRHLTAEAGLDIVTFKTFLLGCNQLCVARHAANREHTTTTAPRSA